MAKKEELTKLERRRKERDERINQMKTKDGGKKAIRTGSRLGRILFPLVFFVLILLLLTWLGFSTGFVQSRLSPLQIGTKKISMDEYNYYFRSMYSTYNQFVSYGMAPAGADGKLDMTQLCTMPGYEDKTWKDYILDQSDKKLQEMVALASMAAEKNFQANPEDEKAVDEYAKTVREMYPDPIKQQQFLEDTYGRGMSLEKLRAIQMKMLLVERFKAEYPASYEIPQADIDGYYEKNKDTMDLVSYRQFVFMVPADADKDEAKKAAQEENKKKAEEMLAAIQDDESFKNAAIEYAPADQKENYSSGDITLNAKKTSSFVSNTDIHAWLYDAARKNGDKTVLSSGTSEYVLYFDSREKLTNKMPHIRSILLGDPQAQAAPDEAALLKQKSLAEETVAKIKSSEDMQAEGAALETAGQTRQVSETKNLRWNQSEEAQNAWCYDPARKTGDVTFIETSNGYRILYFEGLSADEEWLYSARTALQNEKFAEDQKNLLAEERFAIKRSNFAMNYVN